MALKRDIKRDIYYCDCVGTLVERPGLGTERTENVRYDLKHKTITCNDCGSVYNVEPGKDRCVRCGAEYQKYAWWVPSGCPKCPKSFVS